MFGMSDFEKKSCIIELTTSSIRWFIQLKNYFRTNF